ncbi:LysR family transcriptional regulator, partial [Ralstonia pseudosolanacearum]
MQRFDDLYLFTRVVEAGGFSAAERATGIPKSRLSRRIAALERGVLQERLLPARPVLQGHLLRPPDR